MKIFVGADHRGFEMKNQMVEFLKNSGHEVVDLGPEKYIPDDDYNDYAVKVATEVQKQPDSSRGLLVCGSGIGMYITANKFDGIRAAEVRSVSEAEEDRKHHDSNVLAISADHTDLQVAKAITEKWLSTEFAGGRHERRIKEIELVEKFIREQSGSSTKIVPALLYQTVEEYKQATEKLSQFVKLINIDVMDGVFVENKTPDIFEILDALKGFDILYSVHLMIEKSAEVLNKLENYKDVVLVYAHVETLKMEDVEKERPYEFAIVLNPDSDVLKYKELLLKVNVVQIMTVVPGAQGKAFQEEALSLQDKLKEIGYSGEIHIDGAVSDETVDEILIKKKDFLNVGSFITRSSNPEEAYNKLLEKVRGLSGTE